MTHICAECFAPVESHPADCSGCDGFHFPPLCCPGCDCQSFETIHGTVPPFPQEPAPGSPEAVEQAANSLRGPVSYLGTVRAYPLNEDAADLLAERDNLLAAIESWKTEEQAWKEEEARLRAEVMALQDRLRESEYERREAADSVNRLRLEADVRARGEQRP